MTAWDNAGLPIARMPQVDAARVHEAPGDFTLLDVRADGEWSSGHLPGARHVHLPQLRDRAGEMPRDGCVVVYCDSGYRASIGASLLRRAGFERVANLPGSLQAWKAAGFALERD